MDTADPDIGGGTDTPLGSKPNKPLGSKPNKPQGGAPDKQTVKPIMHPGPGLQHPHKPERK